MVHMLTGNSYSLAIQLSIFSRSNYRRAEANLDQGRMSVFKAESLLIDVHVAILQHAETHRKPKGAFTDVYEGLAGRHA